MQRKYDVALSFAGEDRQYAKELADFLESGGYKVFYDEYERADLWGRDLYVHLSSIYKDKAHYCVVFLSQIYAKKLWTRHELRSAQARAFEENREYILPVRLDDTEIPGLLPTVMYLDLSEMSIKEVYQELKQKLSGTTLPESTDKLTTTSVQNDLNDYVMIWTRGGIQCFIPVQNALWNSTEISLDLLPETTEEAAFLRSLGNSPYGGSARDVFALALQDDAAWVSPQEVIQSISDSQTIWKVVLKNVGDGQNSSFINEMAIGDVSTDQIAEMRARRILLNEKPIANSPLSPQVDAPYQEMLESFVRGFGISQHETRIQVLDSPIPNLYRNFGHTAGRFLKFTRLVSIFFLKLSGTVEDILELEFDLLSPEQLRVRFKGRRHKRYTNVEPSTISIDDICVLSEP